jgi:hypothetical protein
MKSKSAKNESHATFTSVSFLSFRVGRCCLLPGRNRAARRLTAKSVTRDLPLYFPLKKLCTIPHVISLSVLVIYCCVEIAGRVMVR